MTQELMQEVAYVKTYAVVYIIVAVVLILSTTVVGAIAIRYELTKDEKEPTVGAFHLLYTILFLVGIGLLGTNVANYAAPEHSARDNIHSRAVTESSSPCRTTAR